MTLENHINHQLRVDFEKNIAPMLRSNLKRFAMDRTPFIEDSDLSDIMEGLSVKEHEQVYSITKLFTYLSELDSWKDFVGINLDCEDFCKKLLTDFCKQFYVSVGLPFKD